MEGRVVWSRVAGGGVQVIGGDVWVGVLRKVKDTGPQDKG